MAKAHITLHDSIRVINNRVLYNLYLQDIQNYKVLTRDEEYEYFRQLKAGNYKLRDELVKRNALFVIAVAKQYQGLAKGALAPEDLICEGNVGLCIAIDKFDYTKGYKFISYAVFWIKQCILECLKNNMQSVRIPSNRQQILSKINTLERELEQELDYHVDIETLALRAVERGVIKEADSISFVGHLKNDNGYCTSLSQDISSSGRGEELYLIDVLKNEDSVSPDAQLNIEDMNTSINDMMTIVPDHIRDMIELFYGIGTPKPLSTFQIGMIHDLTGERVRQLIMKYVSRMGRKFEESKMEIMS